MRTFADFLVYEFSTSAGGQQLNKCIEILNDMVWKYNIVTLDRLILCLVRIHLLKNRGLSSLILFGSLLMTNGSCADLLYVVPSKVKVAQSCLTLCDPMDYTVHGILQAMILEWVAFPCPRGSSQPRDRTQVSCIAGRFFTV